MNTILKVSRTTLVRAGALLSTICLLFTLGCVSSSCEITVSGPGSLCNIRYTDNDSITHNIVVQSDSDIITIDDCDEVLEVNCSQ
jgi:hypothetical protein